MSRITVLLILGAMTCSSCASESTTEQAPESNESTTSTFVTEQPIADSALPSEIREDQLATYTMVMQFLSQTISTSSKLREEIQDVDSVAVCMVNAGYQINNIPPLGAAGSPTTVVSPERMISPMLTYLTESCTGIPASEWQTD